MALYKSVCCYYYYYYSDECVCGLVCLSATTCPISPVCCACHLCHGSVLFWQCCNTVCTSSCVDDLTFAHSCQHMHTHTRLTDLFPGLPGWVDTRKVIPIWIWLKHETASGSGINWAICKSAPCSRQITTPAPYHSVFLQAGCPSSHPTNSINALKAMGDSAMGDINQTNPPGVALDSMLCLMSTIVYHGRFVTLLLYFH